MAYRSLLKHRCQVLRLKITAADGSPISTWQPLLGTDGQPLVLRCFLDLNFIRKGKDPMWTAEAGRPQDRTGVWFGEPSAPLKSGDRIKMTRGPAGVFSVEGAIDEAWQPSKMHHREVGVSEVANQLARAAESQSPYNGQGGSFGG